MSRKENIILNIKIWLLKNNMNQTDLAKILGISKQRVSQIFKNKKNMPQKIIELTRETKGEKNV